MNRRNSLFVPVALIGSILVVSTLHYLTPVDYLVAHQIYQRVYYIPIILAAFRYGWRGGLGAAALAGLSYLPHILMHWQHLYFEYALNQYAEITLFFVIGAVTGWLGDQRRREHDRAEKINAELEAAYKNLRETVGQLLQAERLSSLAEVASGVVHEVRNPLGAIKGAVEILEDEIAHDSPRREFARIAKVEVERIDKLVQEFLAFARPPNPSKAPTDLNDLVNSAIRLIEQRATKSNIRIKTELSTNLPHPKIDREQIMQVLLNLLINSIDVMKGGGVVTIRTEADADTFSLEIEDIGGGIPEDAMTYIFDPFFTTKDRGTGLGLAVAQKIVASHGGTLTAENTGGGARFTLTLKP